MSHIMSYLRNVFWSFTVDVNKLLNVLRTLEDDESTSKQQNAMFIVLLQTISDSFNDTKSMSFNKCPK